MQHFNATLKVPQAFTWTNVDQISAVNRSQGVNVTWSGGAPGSFVSISGSSISIAGGNAVTAFFVCQAPVAAGQFSIPAPVLLSLPAGTGSLGVGDYNPLQFFTAPGLDIGILSAGQCHGETNAGELSATSAL